jgi:hypothetical protein
MQVLVDNDIVIKGACYRLLPELCAARNPAPSIDAGVLGSCKYVARDRICRDTSLNDVAGALDALSAFVAAATVVDPTSEEQRLAADLETGAQHLGVPLDVGESQLCAVMVERGISALLTGDKRAIGALEQLLDLHSWLDHLRGRVHALEQLVLAIVELQGSGEPRTKICSEPSVDSTLDICFRCHDSGADAPEIAEGLASYINDLRSTAPRVLAD